MAQTKLIISVAGQAAREVALNGSVSIGRAADNTVTLDDPGAARYHAIIERRGEAYWLSDLGSVNGTRINGEAVAGERQIGAGDVIALGGATTIKVAGETPVASPEALAAAPPNASASSASPTPSASPDVPPSPPPNLSSNSSAQSLSGGMIGAAVAVGLIITIFIGAAGYLIYQKSRRPDGGADVSSRRGTVSETPTPARTAEVAATPTAGASSVSAGALDVRLAAQSLATQLTGKGLDYYYFEPEFLNEIAGRTESYRAFSLADARRFQRETNMAFSNAGVKPVYGFVLALSESKFNAGAGGEGVGLWQIPQTALGDYVRGGEDPSALAEPKRAAEVAAAYLKERLDRFDDADFMYAVASYRLPMRQVGELRRNLEAASAADRRNFWKMVNSGVVPRAAAEQVVRFFAAGIVGENPQAFGLPPGRLSDL